MTRLLAPADLPAAAALLRDGQLVAMPTETVYGLAADALSPTAVARVFEAKGRPADDPLIVHVSPALLAHAPTDGLAALGLVDAEALSATARAHLATLTARAWPGPLTLVLPRGPAIHDAITAGLPSVAVRMPAHPLAQALIDAAGRPLVAPSANRFGRISPTTARAALSELDGRIAAVLDGGPCTLGVESTVLRLHPDGHTTLLRPGGVPAATIAAWLGEAPHAPVRTTGPQVAPGQLDSHYAPAAPVALLDAVPGQADPSWSRIRAHAGAGPIAWLSWRAPPSVLPHALPALPVVTEVLAPDGRPETAAHRLYACLRALDAQGPTLIVVERPPGAGGLFDALHDRLGRAASGGPRLQG